MKRHRFDPASFVLGVIAFTVGIWFLRDGTTISSLPDPAWLVPVGVIIAGSLLVDAAVRPKKGAARAARAAATAGVAAEDED